MLKAVVLALAAGVAAAAPTLSPEAASWLHHYNLDGRMGLPREPRPESVLDQGFQKWKSAFNKSYKSVEAEAEALANFALSVERVVERNKIEPVYGLTKFADLSADQFAARFLSGLSRTSAVFDDAPVLEPRTESVPEDFDWRAEGKVTDVKNQGYCGSCWAHSTVETIESAWAIAGNDLTAFSVQQVTACDTKDGGCDGGDPPQAYKYVKKAGGLASEADYPYDDDTFDGDCSACKADFEIAGGAITGYTWATPTCSGRCKDQNETQLMINTAQSGAPSVCVDASKWNDYDGGIMTGDSCSKKYWKLDHCVQLVGYNTTAPTPYWIVRNSWDSDWGHDGCIYLKMGENTCGVADEATLPILA